MLNTMLSYIIAGCIVFLVSFLPSGTMKVTKGEWYKCIKPSITPPNFVFPIVWTILYIMIWFVLANVLMMTPSKQKTRLLILFGINLFLNVSWSFAYFGSRDILFALIILIFIIISLIGILYTLWSISKTLTYILIPYLAWLCFAGILNTLSFLNIKKCKNIE